MIDMIRIQKMLTVALAAAVLVPVASAEISIAPDREGALYRAGEEATFTVTVSDGEGNALKSGEAAWKLDNFGDVKVAEGKADLAKGNPFTVKGTLKEPGFLRLSVKAAKESYVQSVGYDVERIRQSEPCPADFDEYWAAEKARLEREVPLSPRRVLDTRLSNGSQTVYRVSFATFGGKRVYGFLRVPRPAAKPLPFVLQVTDAGRGAIGPWINAPDAVSLTMNVHMFEPAETPEEQTRRMTEANAKLSKEFGFKRVAYCGVIGIGASREKYHYHDVMLGINRAVDWAATLPEVDPSRMVYFGSSQGGGFGLFLNYLNGHFSRAFIVVSAITGHYGFRQKRANGWPQLIAAQPDDASKANAERYAAYFDGVNFAARIRHSVRFGVGFRDQTCPPHCVYSAYNVCPSPDKAIINAVDSNHGGWLKWCRKHCSGEKEYDYLDWVLQR
jgi:cephalosporin-C deacetylase-like acetyl esterase